MSARLYRLISIMVAVGALGYAGAAAAYMGPGSGLAAIGALLSLIGAGVMAVVGFIWFPIRRLLRGKGKPAPTPSEGESPPQQ